VNKGKRKSQGCQASALVRYVALTVRRGDGGLANAYFELADSEVSADGLNPLTISYIGKMISKKAPGRYKKITPVL
jgi:hypothetical protein